MKLRFIMIIGFIGMPILLLTSCNLPLTAQPSVTPFQQLPGSTETTIPAVPLAEKTGLIFLVALEDNGLSGKKIGCDDSLVGVEVSINPDQPEAWSALSVLLSLDGPYFGESGLYNALYQSDLEIQSYETHEGKAIVYLEGELMLGGVCDTPRVEEQILATILQDVQIEEVEVYINDVLLQEALSLK
jgi:hypothetical protein